MLFLAFIVKPLYAQEPIKEILMHSHGSQTYYIDTDIASIGHFSMLVDTGSGYSVINEGTLQRLIAVGQASYISKLRGIMADGSERIVPLYKIASISLGKNCVINNIEVAVLPNNSRQIIGISTLMQAAPFSMSFNPPTLILSHCNQSKQVTPKNAVDKISKVDNNSTVYH